jgi:hypothetical protein
MLQAVLLLDTLVVVWWYAQPKRELKRYELMYVVADELDVIRLRSNAIEGLVARGGAAPLSHQ